MQGEHTPSFPADAKNLGSLINFITNIKACDAWMKLAKEVIARNQKLLTTIGKAAEIDKLHAQAAELKEVVLGAIEERDKAFAEDKKNFNAAMAKRRATMQQEEHDSGARATVDRNEATRLVNEARAKDKAASEALKDAQKVQDQAHTERAAATALRAELEAQKKLVQQMAKQVA